ncbi:MULTISPECIES: MarR family winged helix-turn-helix transcriptional regulator [unclassified Streptomyces]|uniref:MarR family winged helix-turn-helix transcriptional regulator n=1 Tax=unclassified Streptomyces TaxID=2593676 RepID=UPI002E1874FA|nr:MULTISPECIES: hypothetical protein [unclassified Streptomyces]
MERRPSPHDGRSVLIALTPTGRALAELCATEMDQAVAELTEPLTATERGDLQAVAAKLLRAAAPDDGASGA